MELPLHVALEAPEWLQPESVAYMWFTSGSTGQPKGVLISHRAFSNWCKVKNPPQGISRESVVLIASASTFDPSIGDIFATWAVGGTVAVAPRMLFFANLGWTIERLTVSHVTCTPSLWQSLETTEMDCSSLTLCLGGERSPQPLLDLWAPKLTLLNTYGTTECTVWQTLRRMELGDKATLVGSPYAGNEIEILEKDGTTEVPDGEVGEIVQGGMQVGIGYYNRPELTAQKFVERPGRNGKWYRTGDGGILRREPRCELEVVGRFDSQVKIRGMRVELGEIEIGVVKAAAGLLSNCAVKLRDSFLVAYCQVSAAASVMLHEPYCIMPVMSDFLLQRSSHELPRHMLPSKFILMQRLPLTANGKVDNKALPEVVDASTSTSSSLTALERVVAGIWEEVLGRKGIGPNDHFLALGGHSMSVLQVSRRLLKLAAAAGQDVSPASALGILLSPEKLIHSPRLRIYCQMLARGGVRFAAVGGSEEEQIGEEDVAELRINYVKHKVKSSDAELDHGATGWPRALALPRGMLILGKLGRASEAGLLPLVQLDLLWVMCWVVLISAREAHGTPVLHKAAERCGERMVALLLKARADVEAMDTASRSTALHAAVKAGNVATTTALLQSSARMDWLDRWNRTALHWAIFHNHLEGCKAGPFGAKMSLLDLRAMASNRPI
ncbi:Tyrocidine synthase 2 (Tyrocidine synthase II) [Includes: ATP-dependent proline adenylase (ProA) (Proline activase) [Durusdinium trenchii]|uniref:Tyrocidine synthase 2 (Tyrocidine synthase II) n=1 Tax=Durusdinium trenchii TaxID=1381693 RepID=A0ABP0INM5_9DINO